MSLLLAHSSGSALVSYTRSFLRPRVILAVLCLIALVQSISYLSLSSPATLIEKFPLSSKHYAKQTVASQGHVADKVATGRVLVTGGGGNIGKHIVHRLLSTSTPVTILDNIFYPEELDFSTLPPASRSLLRVHIGDIRNATALDSALTPDVVGIVHLAAVSRVLWCLENEKDCWDVNERGTQVVLDALTRLNKSDRHKRWFIFASSREVYGDATDDQPIAEDAEKNPANIYGASKLAAERVIEKHLQDYGTSSGSLYTAALRLSNVYGGAYDHLERLVPSIATQALSHQLIQISGGQQYFDLVHIDDVADAFLLAIRYLSKSLRPWSPFSPRTSFEAFNVASGDSVPVGDLVNTLVGLTRSKSPIQQIPGDSRFPNVYRGNTKKSEKVLGYRASINVEQGLLKLVKVYLRRTEAFLNKRVDETCGKASPSLVVNTQLEKLNDCSVHVEVDVQGQFVSLLSPNQDEGRNAWSTEDKLSVSAYKTFVSRSVDGNKTLLRIRTNDEGPFLGILSARPGPISLDAFWENDVASHEGVVVDWELEVNPEESAVRLVVPGTDLHLQNPKAIGGSFSLVSKATTGDAWPFRITPMCCPAPVPWPFLRDDPLEFSIEYQRTELEHPFLSSPAKALCNRLNKARSKVTRDLLTISAANLAEPRRKLSSLPTDWANAKLPACTNLCDHPTICVDTGDCQCVLSSCTPLQRFPFSSSANLPVLSFPPPLVSNVTSLVEMVERSSWRNVLRPQASRLVGTHTPFPRVHVSALPPDQQRWFDGDTTHDITKLRAEHCFTADYQLERAVRLMNGSEGVEAEGERDMTFVPHYQVRMGSGQVERAYEYARENVKGFDASRVIMPFTHDWGQCMDFDWDVWLVRKKQGLKVSPIVRSTMAWSVMADLNSPCYRPHQDVVIPPRTCLSSKLVQTFPTIASVRPARQRRVLATFSGTVWGTGATNRQKLMCGREGWRDNGGRTERRLYPDGPKLRSIWWGRAEYEYTDLLNDTIFCPQPAGTTGWATRLVDSVYAGCIPILIGQAAHFPFFDVIDWSKISVRIEPSELSDLEDILLKRYTLQDIERLQANLMLVRNAFVYPLDDASDAQVKTEMVDERGPLFYALWSTRMRMLMKWPSDGFSLSDSD